MRKHLLQHLRDPEVTLTLGSVPDRRSVAGQHVVGTDGKILLGVFGEILVENLSLIQARGAIEELLAKSYESIELWVRLRESNSQFIHVVLFQRGKGTRVTRVKYDGHTTVLDAIAALEEFTSLDHVRLTRSGSNPQILNVEWPSIQSGSMATNYQLQPGDVVTVSSAAQ